MRTDRLSHFDGLRGFAALSVVLFHLLSALAPSLVPEQQGDAVWISYTPVAVIWNGTFAVSLFFSLSGFVLTNATLRKPDPLWINVVIRYLRLSVPALLSTCFAWILLKIFPTQASELHRITHSNWLLWTYQNDIPNFATAIYSGAFDVFLRGGSYFNNVLWTMRPELLGSVLCFMVCLFETAKNRIIMNTIFLVAIFVTKKYEYESFIIGIYLREAWIARRLTLQYPTLAAIVGLIVGSQSGDAAGKLGLGWLPNFLALGTKESMLYPIAAGLIVYGCIDSTVATYVLSGKLGSFLGSISFPLYLIHVPIIYTVFSFAYLGKSNNILHQILLLIFVFAMMIVTAYMAEVFVEKPFLRRLGKLRCLLNHLNSHLHIRSR